VSVAANLSPVQFKNRNLLSTVVAALAAAQLAPSRLELEITETVLLDDSQNTENFINDLAAAGVRFALDDFGTG
jgi:EAL domain-containing protein (putative c-di-GMP-specific phosphodiesterase class I)